MKREIKFRVWNGIEMEYNITAGKFGVFFVNPENGDGLDPRDSSSLTPYNTKYPDDIPIMQYTGLKDKNGREVYEGDIVKFTRYGKYFDNGNEIEGMVSSIHEVYFDDELLEFGLKYTFAMFHCQFANQFEVIGNIYDNPELLKETEQ